MATLLVPSQYSTIQAAVGAASSGDTVRVSAGTYNENVIIVGAITLEGEGPSTIIQGAEQGNITKTASWGINSKTLQIAAGTSGWFVGRYVSSSVGGFPSSAKIVAVTATTVTLDRVTTAANSGAVTMFSLFSTISVRDSGTVIRNLKAIGFDSLNPAVELAVIYFPVQNNLPAASNFVVENCTLVAAGESAILSDISPSITNGVIRNNYIMGQTFVGNVPASGNPYVVWNVPRNLVSIQTAGATNISVIGNVVEARTGGLDALSVPSYAPALSIRGDNCTATNNLIKGDYGNDFALVIDGVGSVSQNNVAYNVGAFTTAGYSYGATVPVNDILVTGASSFALLQSKGSNTGVPTQLFSIATSVSVGQVVYQVAGSDNTVDPATPSNPPIGIAVAVNGSIARVALNGEIATGLSGLTRGATYWLDTTPGALTSTKPASNAYIVGVAISATELLVNTVAADLDLNQGGPGGTVTQVGLSSPDLTIGGSPVSGAGGTFTLSLNTVSADNGGTGLTAASETGAMLLGTSVYNWVSQATNFTFRNRLINGAMQVSQRNASSEVTTTGGYPVDRWQLTKTGAGSIGASRSTVTTNAGYEYTMRVRTITASAPGAADLNVVGQKIEGLRVADLAWGTANAKPVTLSFFGRGTAGTYAIRLANASQTRSYVATYTQTITTGFQYHTITIPGDTAGVWLTDNNVGIELNFDFGSGTNYDAPAAGSWNVGNFYRVASASTLIATAAAAFSITGVQLEVGSVATLFESLPAAKLLDACMRYYAKIARFSGNYTSFGAGVSTTTATARVWVKYPQPMRTTPTLAVSGTTAVFNTTNRAVVTVGTPDYGSDSLQVELTTAAATQTIGQGVLWTASNNSTAFIALDAEF